MKWTKEAPKVPGWYWCRQFGPGGGAPVYVDGPDTPGFTRVGHGWGDRREGIHRQWNTARYYGNAAHEWSGPIPEPEEVDDE